MVIFVNKMEKSMHVSSSSNPSKSSSDGPPIVIPSKETNDSNSRRSSSGSMSSSCYPLNLTQQIFQLRRNSVDVDVYLLSRRSANDVTPLEFPCHKLFLRTCPYFTTLLDNGTQSNTADGQMLKIEIDLEPNILEEIIRYIYTGKICIDRKNVLKLFEASLKLQLNGNNGLMMKFTKFQIGHLINEENWLENLRICNSAEGGGLAGHKFLKEIFGFLREKSSEFMNSHLFLQLTFDEIRLILNPESRVFKSANYFQASLLKWMHYEASSKGQYIEELSKFNYVELPEIIDLSEPEPDDQKKNQIGLESGDDSDEDGSEISSIISDEGSSSDSEFGEPYSKRCRLEAGAIPPSNGSLLFCAGDYFYIYSFVEDKSRKMCQLPAANLRGFSMVLANNRIYILGGFDQTTRDYTLSSQVYSCPIDDLKLNKNVTWRDEKNLFPVANLSTIFLNNIYTVGGISNNVPKNIYHKPTYKSIEYNFLKKWDEYYQCKFARTQCAIAHLNDMLYIVGGIGHLVQDIPDNDNIWRKDPHRFKPGFEDTAIESVEVINTIDERVEILADLNLARFDHQAVAFQDKIFAIGGKVIKSGIKYQKEFKYKATNSVEIFDPITKLWTEGPSLIVPRANFATFVKEGKIFVVGGNTGKMLVQPSIEVYNPLKNKWELIGACSGFPLKTNFSKFLLIN